MRVLIPVLVLALVAGRSIGAAAELAIYVDGTLQAGAPTALHKAPDFHDGPLAGWRLFGALLPRGTRENLAVIEAVGADGTKVRLQDPDRAYAGLEPVVVVDPGGGLRFRMLPDGGRSPASKAVATGDPARSARLGVKHVSEIHVAHGAPPAPAATPEAFDLVVAGRTARITLSRLRALAPPEHPRGAPGDAWPLRALLVSEDAADARAVVVLGRDDAKNRLPAADLDTAYLRINKRGLFKLERLDATGKRLANFPDVKRIDVELH